MSAHENRLDRREFLKSTAAGVGVAAVGASALPSLGAPSKAEGPSPGEKKDVIWRNKVDGMEYRRLGRTNYMVSRLVQGFAGDEALWRRLMAKGWNYWDTAWGYGNGNSETGLGPFVKKYRDKLWVTSKSTDVAGYSKIDEKVAELFRKAMKDYLGTGDGNLFDLHNKAVEKQAKTGEKPDLRPAGHRMAELYASKLDDSLKRLQTDHVDCYFVHGVEIPWMFQCTELWETYDKAHQAGKIKHFGFSTHNHQKEVLAAAAVANDKGPWKIDLVMPGVNPITFDEWRAELNALRKQDVGVVAMKTAAIKGRDVGGRLDKLKGMMDGKEYNEWERCKLYMLHLTEKVVDACIAATSSNEQMERNAALPSAKLNAAAARELRAIVKLEMATACHLCGNCETTCPEHIAVADMVRYHAYLNQYNEKDLARQLYRQAGYDPSKICSNCGKCEDACSSGVPITQILHQLSAQLA